MGSNARASAAARAAAGRRTLLSRPTQRAAQRGAGMAGLDQGGRMIEHLKRIFAGQPAAQGLLEQREPLELATAALLIELARSDFSESSAELDAIRQLLQKRFNLDAAAVAKLLAEAGRRADDAISLHEFTHRLNLELPESEKLGIVE